jgi:uncharacterized protein DUF2188
MRTMTRGAGVHTVPNPRGRGWANEVCGTLISRHRRKAVAVAWGRRIARVGKVEHSIHGKDGRITTKNSYGSDPCPPKDGR